jgi:hypothetical protein
VRECKPTLPTYMQVSTLSYIQEALCDDVQPCVTAKLSEIRHNCRSNHNKRYLYQLCRPHGGECPPASCPGVPNKRYLPIQPTQIKKSFFTDSIASPKDHTAGGLNVGSKSPKQRVTPSSSRSVDNMLISGVEKVLKS